MRAPVLELGLLVWAIAPSALTIVVLCTTDPTAVVVVMVLNFVGEAEVTSEDDVILIEEVAFFVAVPVGMRVASEFGRVVCPEVRTAHAPARTTVRDILGKAGRANRTGRECERAGARDSTGSSSVGV
jgi:hypothetical protein